MKVCFHLHISHKLQNYIWKEALLLNFSDVNFWHIFEARGKWPHKVRFIRVSSSEYIENSSHFSKTIWMDRLHLLV
uniref:Uncharacterized protein n=1 Tax=Anguilla anguilla TaxID=7936 RepID=A0A0E9X409_ANGAN